LQLGCREIVLDLRDCESMDSTFLGVIAGFAFSLGSAGSLTLLDMNSDACRALSELGLDQLPSLHTGVAAVRERLPSESEFRLLPGSEPAVKPSSVDAIDRAVLMLESHEYLCRIDQRNEEKFREVKEFLRQDIARRGGQGH
jgi:hypothetical protein